MCVDAFFRNVAGCAPLVALASARWDTRLRWDTAHQTRDVFHVDCSVSGLITAAFLCNHWKEAGTFQEQFI